jgi:hypothetical protein
MTLRSPDENSPLRSIFSGITLRDLVVAALTIIGGYCAMQIRISTFAEQQAEQQRQIDVLVQEQTQKVDDKVYRADQQHLQMQLSDISETVHGINQFLLERSRDK